MLFRMLPFLLFSFSVLPAFALAGGVEFVEGELDAVKAEAVREGKMLFVHFTADWCLPCRWMERETYPDTALAAFVQAHFIPLKVDIDRPEGIRAKQQYQVVLLPSMLVFDRGGQLVARMEESLSPADLLDKLEKAVQGEGSSLALRPAAPPAEPFRQVLDNPFPDINQGQADDPLLHPASPSPVPATAEAAGEAPRFAVQLGVFGQFENAQRQAESMGDMVDEDVRVQPGTLEGKSIFRVLVGRFRDLAQAEAYRRQLANRHDVKGVVKDISTF